MHEAFQRLTTVPIHRAQIRPLLTDAWAKRDNLTIADALYVTLAEHVHATLVTADMRIVRAPGLSVVTIHP